MFCQLPMTCKLCSRKLQSVSSRQSTVAAVQRSKSQPNPCKKRKSRSTCVIQASRGLVLIMPAYYTDAKEFIPLAKELTNRGYVAALPPIRWFNWAPTLGGRSVRPILDRMDYALTRLVEGYQVSEENGFEIPLPSATNTSTWFEEMKDASKGAYPSLPATGRWEGKERAAIVASSASGWISRILLGGPPGYGGRVYHGADRVHTLITLGSPHRSAEPITRKNIDYVNTHFPGCHMPDVRYVCVGSRAVQGQAWLGGSVQDIAYQSYSICCGKGEAWGDGIIPLECALDLEGAHKVELTGAWHVPMEERNGRKWYGSPAYLATWEHFLQPSTQPAVALQ